MTDDDQEFGGCVVFLAPLLLTIALGGCIQKPEPVVLWCRVGPSPVKNE